jgi:ATP-dependent protease ClpP protease subunit
MKLNFFLLLFLPFFSFGEVDFIPIDTVINKQSVDMIQSIFHNEPNRTDWTIYFNTPGGSVIDGIRLLPYFEKNNMTCIVDRAYSMGFLLFQACSQRYILPYGSLMQHDMTLGFQDEYTKIQSYMNYIRKLYNRLVNLQIKRIGITKKEFLQKIRNDWWMNAEESIKNNCADKIIPSLTDHILEKLEEF